MELSILSSPHVYLRISRNEEFLCRTSSGLVATTRGKLRGWAAVSAGRDPPSPSARVVKDEGCRLGFSDCALDGNWLHTRRRREAAGCWKWRCLSVESERSGSSESSPGSVHFVGIGGSGLSALALLALRQVRFSL
jgi:hypothetical protein